MSLVEVFFENLQYYAVGLGVFLLACLMGFAGRAAITWQPSYVGYAFQYGMMAWGLRVGLGVVGI
jgi:hypothetical protein